MTFDHIIAFWGHHLIVLGIWLTLTLSLNLINGYCGLFSLGHQGFWAAGAFAAAAVMAHLPADVEHPTVWAYLLSFLAGGVVASAFGLAVGVPCLRLRGDYLAIATLGFSEIQRNVIQNSTFLGQSMGLEVKNFVRIQLKQGLSVQSAGLATYGVYFVLAWGLAALTLVVLRNLIGSSHGRAIQAIRDDERAAELLGVNLTFYKVFVFALGAGFAGLAGALYANYNSFVTLEDFNFNIGVLMVVMVVLGGMGNFTGTILATAVLYFIPVLLALFLPAVKVPVFYDPTQGGVVYSEVKNLWQVFFSMLLIVVVLVRPQGILARGEKAGKAEAAKNAP
jgi:branched-chain amino acid transport system permease protein